MRILVLNTDYTEFLAWRYAGTLGLAQRSYDEQMRARNDSLFGVADFYSRNLRALGHEAWEIHANNLFLQAAWAREHGVRSARSERITLAARMAPRVRRWGARLLPGEVRTIARSLFPSVAAGIDYAVLRSQINHYRPDVILNQAIEAVSAALLRDLAPRAMLVGQVASPLSGREDLTAYDLMLSSLPNYVEWFRHQGLPAELHPFAFDPIVLSRLGERTTHIALSFVGSLSPDHSARIRLLEYVAARLPLEVWGRSVGLLSADSPLRARHRGDAWGVEMYRLLYNSQITLNHHIGVAGRFANNMRLFEATGVGTCLVTDLKDNLVQLFSPEEEVVVYSNDRECAEKIRFLLDRPSVAADVARRGQQRTLRDHTYARRVSELADVLQAHVQRRDNSLGRASEISPPISPACPLCGAVTDLHVRGLFDDRYGFPGFFDITRCPECAALGTWPRPRDGQTLELYTQFYPRAQLAPQAIATGLADPRTWTGRLRLWLSGTNNQGHLLAHPGMSVLDYGCGAGRSLLELRLLGAEGYGIEVDRNVAPIASHHDLRIHIGSLSDDPFPGVAFDLITLNQVIEHVPDPLTLLEALRHRLKPEGRVVLVFPNTASIYRRIFRSHWINWHVPYHLHHFSLGAFQRLCHRLGWRITSQRTITPNIWTLLQLQSLMRPARPSVPNPHWIPSPGDDPEERESRVRQAGGWRRAAGRPIRGITKGVVTVVNRIVDALGLGDSLLVIIEPTDRVGDQ